MTILEQLADYARERTEQGKRKRSLEELKKQALSLPDKKFEFENAIKRPGLSFIASVKKLPLPEELSFTTFRTFRLQKEYEAAGAECISVLTEPKWFLGSNEYLKRIAGAVSVPCLRKDFTVDEYMIYEARVLGASAVLLIRL